MPKYEVGHVHDGRKHRKRRCRSKTGRKNPAASEALKKKWADPLYREKQSRINREVLPVGRRTRSGIPDGMTRAEAEPLWQKAEQQADIVMSALLQSGQLEFDPNISKHGQFEFHTDISEEQMAWWCLREAFVIALSPINDGQIKNSALRLVLAHTKAKPAVEAEITIQEAAETEAWLKTVIEDHLATSQSAPAAANAQSKRLDHA